MPLRQPNNPNTSKVIMNVLKGILPVGTQLAAISQSGTGAELIYVQAKYKMALNMNGAIVPIAVGYYSRWDDRNETIDAIWDDLDTDIERMCANVESNDDTEYQGTNHTISLDKISLSSYEDQKDETFVGLTLVKRVMTLTYTVLPYGS